MDTPAHPSSYIGVTIATRKSEFFIVVLDSRTNLIQAGDTTMEDLVLLILEQPACLVVTDFPSRPNIGLMDDIDFRS